MLNKPGMSGGGGSQGGHCHPPNTFEDQLTLFQPRVADSVHRLLLAPQGFFIFRHHSKRIHRQVNLLIMQILCTNSLAQRAFNPHKISLWRRGSPAVTHSVPNTYGPQTFGHPPLVPNWLVPLDPNQFCPHGQMVPINLVPMDKWSPTNLVPHQFGPLGQMVPEIFCLSRGTGCDNLGIWRSNCLGIICLWGQEVGDRKPGDQMGSGPNELQPVYMGHSDVLSFIVLRLVL